MNCVKCKAALPEGAIYCPMCGKKQVPEKRKALKRANGTGTVYKLQGRRKRPWVAAKNKVVIGYYERKIYSCIIREQITIYFPSIFNGFAIFYSPRFINMFQQLLTFY